MNVQDFCATRLAHAASTLSSLAGQTSEVDRLRSFWRRVERFGPGAQVRLSSTPRGGRRVVVVSGWACELRILPDGRRQIFGFMLPGEVIDERCTTSIGSRGVIALSRLEVIDADATLAGEPALRQLFAQAVAEAALEREERLYDHILRLGRLSARERVVHLLLDLRERMDRVGLVKENSFRVPLTHEVLADALGLSVVHINRTMKQLRLEGLVSFKSGAVTLADPERLAIMCHYQSPGTFADELAPFRGPPADPSRTCADRRAFA
ncbi:MAG TPA: Crp/Fnr family transcriptional regulator [Caulobacteraceae bacterium]|jgi:CRP-like cAMP-binding protein